MAFRYRIEVIDLMRHPQLAQGDQILALPTLVRKLPAPIRKVIGDLSNTERVFVGLDLRPRESNPLTTGPAIVPPGSREGAARVSLNGEAKPQQLPPKGKRAPFEEEIATLLAEHAVEGATITRLSRKDRHREAAVALDKAAIGRRRRPGTAHTKPKEGKRA